MQLLERRETVQDKYGNVTNYYRSGDTNNTQIIDSYNKTFNTIHNTTNNTTTNNYKANVKLENFLNQYTTNNNNYTYSADFKSWYYDNTTNINNEKVGDVTNVYYYELKDGRNSSTLTAAEVAGMDFGYDVKNYELVTDDPNTLSLQHFDGDYNDSSSFNRSYYSQNRSTTYVDSGAFGKAVSLPNGAAAGVTIPNLSSYSSLSFDFRIYYTDIFKLGIYFGDTNIFQEVVPTTRVWKGRDVYSDDGKTWPVKCPPYYLLFNTDISLDENTYYDVAYLKKHYHSRNGSDSYFLEDVSLVSTMTIPTSYLSSGFEGESSYSKKFGWMSYSTSTPSVTSRSFWQYKPSGCCFIVGDYWQTSGVMKHYIA